MNSFWTRILAVGLLVPVPAVAIVFDDGGTHVVSVPVIGDGVQVLDGVGPSATDVTVTTIVSEGVSVNGISIATLDGAETGSSVFALGDATLNVLDSEIGNDIFANDMAEVFVGQTTVLNNIFALGYAVMDVGGATVADPNDPGGDIFANDDAQITVHSGTVVDDDLFTNDNGFIAVEDAVIGDQLFANGTSQIDWSGGSLGDRMEANGEATLRIFGDGFQVDGSPVPFGPLVALTGQLTGELADGTPLDNPFERAPTAEIIVVAPEPGGFLVLLAGGALVLRLLLRRDIV